MRLGPVLPALLLGLMAVPPATPQPAEEFLDIYTEHPRLFLRAQRLRLLQRERERESMRWTQFQRLIAGNAPLPEPGFALALYYQVARDEEAARRAIAFALSAKADLRQQALVFDWCQPALRPEERQALAGRLAEGLRAPRKPGAAAQRDRLLAAVALAGDAPEAAREIEYAVREWWRAGIVPKLRAGEHPLARTDSFALLEILHAVRDNTQVELREGFRQFFVDLPIFHLLSYYPPSYPAAENEYHIPWAPGIREPDLDAAALSRVAELAMVAYDTNAPETQVLQGWLMNDRFLLRGPFGAPYEFLWANPYQPGLSYFHVPLVFYSAHFGRLFARSSWDEDATWLGFAGGELQVFMDGSPEILPSGSKADVPEALVMPGTPGKRLVVEVGDEQTLFFVGVPPNQPFDIEIDDQELYEKRSDPGGVLVVDAPRGRTAGILVRAR